MSYSYKQITIDGVEYAEAYTAEGECVERILLNEERRTAIFGQTAKKAPAKPAAAKKATRKAKA